MTMAGATSPHPGNARSTFQRALERYIETLPEKKKKRKFIVACCATATPVTPEIINESLKQAEQKHADQPARRLANKILRPVVEVLRNFDDIISTLVSADPMPSAIVWGALKIVIDGAHRSLNLFDTIKKELRLLTTQLQRINDYENLYGDSEMLQDRFCDSYINILRFWSRVDKECDTCWYTGLLKSTSSFSTNKLNKIIKDIEDDADQIEQLASILEATKGKSERQAAELERFRAEMERTSAQKERTAQAAWRQEAESDRQGERYRNISSWLCARQGNEDDMRQLRTLKGFRLSGTCDWLLQHRTYVDWRDGTSAAPILWVHAAAGAGKSILSSRVIQVIEEEPDAIAMVYHFYRFDQMNLASETLRLLASQLLDKYWNASHVIPEEMFMKTQQNVCSLEKVEELITMLVKLLPRSYFILDGLDEECAGSHRWTEAVTTLDFLVTLAKDSPDRVRLWYSSQYRPDINEKLKDYIVLSIKDEVKEDVSVYLSRVNPKLGELEISDKDKDDVLGSLQDRAEGNFLWASLMLKSLKDTTSLSDMKQFVKGGLPDTLDGYYRGIFDRFEKHHRFLVSKIFSLVAFARRPLRVVEVREAVGLLLSKNPLSLNPDDMPFISLLRKLLPPLIEFQQDGCPDTDDCTCRLFHSTVRDFLFKNPGVLQSGMTGDPVPDLLITRDVIANACLLYLCQTRFARPLRKRDARWVDASGESIDRHQFLVYAAKYWDKGMDSMTPSEDLNNRVGSFITSTNFQTCVQVQSLWVDSQFGVFCYYGQKDDRVYLRRMFPAWFVAGTPAGLKLWRDFREFVHEWKYFLHCPRFDNPTSETLPYTGELDRCWWPALGPQNFLAKFKCKLTTFRFESEDHVISGGSQSFEGVGADGKELVTLVLKSRTNGSMVFACEQWRCTPGERIPTIQKTQTIVTDEDATNWRLYVKHSMDETSNMRIGRVPPAAFTQLNDYLRIGTQLFFRDEAGDYIAMPGFNGACPDHPAYVEDFAVRGQFTVLASRRVVAAEMYRSGLSDEKVHSFGPDFLKMEGKSRIDISDVESSYDSDSSSASDSEDAGYETWSECSTEYSDDLEDDVITPWAGPMSDTERDQAGSDSDSDGGSSKSSAVDSLGDGGESDDSQTSVASDSEGSEVEPSAVVGYGYWHNDDKDNSWGDSDSDEDSSEEGGSKARPELKASLTVVDRGSNDTPMTAFHFTKSLPFLLYDSPPIIHPSKSLVVWPLGAGDILFADFLNKTYFVRKLRPSTLHTRHIFMKCHFSPCGLYVHFASLEGQKKPLRRKRKPEANQPVKLALLVSTYRLSARKTSRSPPSLVHRARISLGSQLTLSVSKLPYTLSWTPTDLYFTRSSAILKVSKISLFKTEQMSPVQEPPVLVPRKPIFLPESARSRNVYYFPPAGESKIATVILGSHGAKDSATDVVSAPVDDQLSRDDKYFALYILKKVFGRRSPPLGCYLREDTDLGGWCKCQDRSKLPDDLGIGQLDRRLEKFDPEDDCDLEPYVR